MLDFAIWILRKYGGADTFGFNLVGAGEGLKAFTSELKRFDVIPDAHCMTQIMNSWDIFLRCARAASVHFTPKFHLVGHMILRLGGWACQLLRSRRQPSCMSDP